MKIITEQYFHSLVEGILKEKEKQAELLGKPFNGLSCEEVMKEVSDHLGSQWSVKREQPVKFSKSDINAVASARFYRKAGIQLLMSMVIIILALSVAVKNIPNMTVVGYNIYYTLVGLIGLGFIYIYARKQAKVRKELWRQLGREENKEEK